MLTLLALYIFVHYDNPRLDVVILEVGMGGRYDATNCVTSSTCLVRGITIIDYDHCRVLGNTLEAIAWEKAGIYQIDKSNHTKDIKIVAPHPEREVDAYQNTLQNLQQQCSSISNNISTDETPTTHSSSFALDTNPESVINVFRVCANVEGNGGFVQLVGTQNPRILKGATIGLSGSHQRINAELTVALCEAACRQNDNAKTEILCAALSQVSWPGRCQTIVYPHKINPSSTIMLRLDGAHTVQSIQCGLEWYQSLSCTKGTTSADQVCRILVFNCSHERNPVELLALLQPVDFHVVFFCRSDSERPSIVPKADAAELLTGAGIQFVDTQLLNGSSAVDGIVSWQDTLAGIWRHLERDSGKFATEIGANMNAKDALDRSIKMGETFARIEMFVTGSLYLVGSMLSALDWKEPDAEGELRIPKK
jgi:folylpolyglutamate synthase